MELKLINPFKKGKPKGKMYSFKGGQCENGILSSSNLDAPICGNCLQTAVAATMGYDIECSSGGNMLFLLFWIRVRT
jgi:hypothetical protein